uniref:Uncharacterized protein n=1 Tax=Chromera velia CCMP2878 TaxID=1169474 RepID=A0A0G4HF49_9ALVE|eukprot:Cvel_26785.t1-p1 / transcript=Cvel_26785.t1 / gene=Cvel_26785 / organism=Chromera_velia_CCMP2878 / gene_product=hypothetical protein / transcript_product=hypothetical protein / location=Cvel_scaffold3242:261-2888(+) / protein_length=876 / sequence_SO=supercontig / SO=protein_coding / is_pseudo=false
MATRRVSAVLLAALRRRLLWMQTTHHQSEQTESPTDSGQQDDETPRDPCRAQEGVGINSYRSVQKERLKAQTTYRTRRLDLWRRNSKTEQEQSGALQGPFEREEASGRMFLDPLDEERAKGEGGEANEAEGRSGQSTIFHEGSRSCIPPPVIGVESEGRGVLGWQCPSSSTRDDCAIQSQSLNRGGTDQDAADLHEISGAQRSGSPPGGLSMRIQSSSIKPAAERKRTSSEGGSLSTHSGGQGGSTLSQSGCSGLSAATSRTQAHTTKYKSTHTPVSAPKVHSDYPDKRSTGIIPNRRHAPMASETVGESVRIPAENPDFKAGAVEGEEEAAGCVLASSVSSSGEWTAREIFKKANHSTTERRGKLLGRMGPASSSSSSAHRGEDKVTAFQSSSTRKFQERQIGGREELLGSNSQHNPSGPTGNRDLMMNHFGFLRAPVPAVEVGEGAIEGTLESCPACPQGGLGFGNSSSNIPGPSSSVAAHSVSSSSSAVAAAVKKGDRSRGHPPSSSRPLSGSRKRTGGVESSQPQETRTGGVESSQPQETRTGGVESSQPQETRKRTGGVESSQPQETRRECRKRSGQRGGGADCGTLNAASSFPESLSRGDSLKERGAAVTHSRQDISIDREREREAKMPACGDGGLCEEVSVFAEIELNADKRGRNEPGPRRRPNSAASLVLEPPAEIPSFFMASQTARPLQSGPPSANFDKIAASGRSSTPFGNASRRRPQSATVMRSNRPTSHSSPLSPAHRRGSSRTRQSEEATLRKESACRKQQETCVTVAQRCGTGLSIGSESRESCFRLHSQRSRPEDSQRTSVAPLKRHAQSESSSCSEQGAFPQGSFRDGDVHKNAPLVSSRFNPPSPSPCPPRPISTRKQN